MCLWSSFEIRGVYELYLNWISHQVGTCAESEEKLKCAQINFSGWIVVDSSYLGTGGGPHFLMLGFSVVSHDAGHLVTTDLPSGSQLDANTQLHTSVPGSEPCVPAATSVG